MVEVKSEAVSSLFIIYKNLLLWKLFIPLRSKSLNLKLQWFIAKIPKIVCDYGDTTKINLYQVVHITEAENCESWANYCAFIEQIG